MSAPIIIRLSGVPVGKGRARFVKATGRAYTPQKTRSHEAALRYQAQEVMDGQPPLTGQLTVTVVAAFPIPKSFSKTKRLDAMSGALNPTTKPDCDNILKCLDALNGVVWEDDKLIVAATIRKIYSAVPELTIRVQAL